MEILVVGWIVGMIAITLVSCLNDEDASGSQFLFMLVGVFVIGTGGILSIL